jgi:ectoine hydroxylase-related dioxygenase (phytanoyl-CoA dioxygenase family)
MSLSALDAAGLRKELAGTGFCVARAFWPDESLDRLRREAAALVARFDAGDRRKDFWCYNREGRDVLYRIHNLEQQDEAEHARELFRGGLLHETAARCLDRARATFCAMIVKTPGVAAVPWHRDRVDLAPGQGINLSVFLDDATPENGCIEAVPGSHLLPDDVAVDEVRGAGPLVPVAVRAGDLLIHDVRLVHASGDNTVAVPRRSLIVEFDAAS